MGWTQGYFQAIIEWAVPGLVYSQSTDTSYFAQNGTCNLQMVWPGPNFEACGLDLGLYIKPKQRKPPVNSFHVFFQNRCCFYILITRILIVSLNCLSCIIYNYNEPSWKIEKTIFGCVILRINSSSGLFILGHHAHGCFTQSVNSLLLPALLLLVLTVRMIVQVL